MKRSFLIVMLVLMCVYFSTTRTWGTAFLNLSSIHLVRGMLPLSDPRFPYVTTAEGRSELLLADRVAKIALKVREPSGHIPCMSLRINFALMAWREAQWIDQNWKCDDQSLRVRPAPWSVLSGLAQLDQGNSTNARRDFQLALIEGSGLLSLSLDPWLVQTRLITNVPATPGPRTDIPRFLVGRMVNAEWRPIPEPVSNHWALVGYDFDESALETGELVSVSLFWQPRQADAQPEASWQPTGELWRQDVRLVNLIPDAGFEWAAEGQSGWNGPEDTSQTRQVERIGQLTYVKEIMPNPAGGGTIVASPVMPLGRDCAYLVGGWIRSEAAAHPAISVVWAGLVERPDDRAFVNIIEGQRNMPWTHVSAVLFPKPGARGVSVYASNWNWADGEQRPRGMAVDNLFLIPIPIPESTAICNFYGTKDEH